MKNINFEEEALKEFERITNPNTMVGKGGLMPHSAANSGPRKGMHTVQVEHIYPLFGPEVPYTMTGRENMFARYSSALNKAEQDKFVYAKIEKFAFKPGYHYFLIIQNRDGSFDYVERKCYEHITETYGYIFNNSYLDSLVPGNYINQGTTIQKTTAYDEYDNRQDGINCNVIYKSSEKTKEDAIRISKSCQKRFVSPKLFPVRMVINDNIMPLNLYGDREFYMSFPNIGDKIRNCVLCALRQENKDQSLYNQTVDRLQNFNMSDEKYIVSAEDAEVIDINIYCNNPELLNKHHNAQLKFYYEESMRFAKELIDVLQPLRDQNIKFSPELQKLYYINSAILRGAKFQNERVFSNVILEIVVLERNMIDVGDKLANRYGGKGCISEIVDDELMAMCDNGERADVELNPSGVPNRENIGQSIEQSINMRATQLLDYIREHNVDPYGALEMITDFLTIVSPKLAVKYEETLLEIGNIEANQNIDSYQQYGYDNARMEIILEEFYSDIINSKCLYTVVEPVTETMSILDLEKLDATFPFFRQYNAIVPQKDSNGNYRFINTRKPITMGYQYIYRLKQYAEEKFSVTSLCSTNLKNEPTRSSAKKTFKVIHSSTPIRFGEMETSDLAHMGIEHVVTNLLLNSSSPHGRRLAEEILVGDPYNVDIKLDEDCKNRGVEILNTYLLTMGLELKFMKKPKEFKNAILVRAIEFKANNLRKAIFFDLPDSPCVGYIDKVTATSRVPIAFEAIEFPEEDE